MKISRFLLAATLGLALAFTLSCSSDDGDGDKGKSYGPGCLFSNDKCAEYKDGSMNESLCRRLGEGEIEFKPGGCPTDWKVKCETDGMGIGSNIIYYYSDGMVEGVYGSVTCTKK